MKIRQEYTSQLLHLRRYVAGQVRIKGFTRFLFSTALNHDQWFPSDEVINIFLRSIYGKKAKIADDSEKENESRKSVMLLIPRGSTQQQHKNFLFSIHTLYRDIEKHIAKV